MEIIEAYKQKARESVNNLISSISQENEEQTSVEESKTQKKLIEELASTSNASYQEEQFQYFAGIGKPKQPKCVVCKKTNPKYNCPKCKVKYCSVDHYKIHNLFCTERFFKGEVEALMKRTKAPAAQKRKMVQMMRVNNEQQAQSEAQVMDQGKIEEVNEERLKEILNLLQDGNKEIDLSQNQVRCFEKYLKQIEQYSLQEGTTADKTEQEEQNELFEEYIPFWTVEEGLQQYFVIDEPIPIETFNNSQHKQLLHYRQQTSPIFRQQLQSLSSTISLKKASIFIAYDCVQVIYLTSLLFRSYDGEYLNNPDFLESFLKLYQENLSRQIADNRPNKLSQLALHHFPTVIPSLKNQIASIDNDMLPIFRTWLPFIIDDSIKIFNNKYLCLEALFRILQAFRSKSIAISNKKKGYGSKQLKIIKKLQFLIVFTSQIVYANSETSHKLPEGFIQTNCLQLIRSILSRDKESEFQEASALKELRDEQSKQKQLKISQILIP